MFSAHRKTALAVAIAAACLTGPSAECAAQALTISLPELDAQHSFSIVGGQPVELIGVSVGGRGDFNGDGFDDLLVGARQAGQTGRQDPGAGYAVFGGRGPLTTPLSTAGINGSNGFRANGVSAADYTGLSISSAGDVNGDGLDDFVVGAPGPWLRSGDTRFGKAFVLFGRSAGFDPSLALASLSGTDGFAILGDGVRDLAGFSVASAGDLNDDGVDDLAVGAPRLSPGGRNQAGSAFVVFGKTAAFAPSILLSGLSAGDGFRLDGESDEDFLGYSVSAAGDINGDGLGDLIVGAPFADNGGQTSTGRAYVIFGQSSGFPGVLDLAGLDGSNGFRIDGNIDSRALGGSIRGAGDFNGDGLDDLIVGASYNSESNQPGVGDGYLLFGQPGAFPAIVPSASLVGATGRRLDGESVAQFRRTVVNSAGDINGDGLDDVVLGVSTSDGNSGRAYVVLGRRNNPGSPLFLPALSGDDGYRFTGGFGQLAGYSVASAGDINGDGVDDVAIGAPSAADNGVASGRAFVVYGARPSIFRDGAEAENIVTTFPRIKVRSRAAGSSVHWQTGARCNCDNDSFDFNIKRVAGEMIFDWPAASASEGGLLTGGSYAVLQPDAVIGPASTFSTSVAASATADWRAGADGYLGFRFVNSDSAQINYGYARIRSTAPSGFPVEVVSVSVNITGLPVVVPID